MEATTKGRYFVHMCYEGSAYCGWQIQPGLPTVQQTLDEALGILLKTDIRTMGAGRTDTGVHAKEFYAHFDGPAAAEMPDLQQLTYKLNKVLPHDIAIFEIIPVHARAHARYDAISRTYHYYICTRKDPFWQGRAWIFERKLNLEAMQQATSLLFSYEDFSSFSKSNTQVKTNLCQIMVAQWTREDHLLKFEIKANRFLRNMVRAITGTLVDVGLEKLSPEDFALIIESKDRNQAGYSAPGCGLYLSGIEYPKGLIS